jgi:putative MATE family efflux protein
LPLVDPATARKAISIAAPLMVADAAVSVLWVVDAFFVGKLGYRELAGVGAASYVLWLAMVISNLFYMGAFVLAGQALGAGRRDYASRVIGESVAAAAALGLAVAGALYLYGQPIMRSVAGEAWGPGWEYLLASLPVIPLHYVQLVYDAGFRALGRTKPIMISVAASSALNAALDPILIFGAGPVPPMGVRGAAYASVAAAILASAMLAAWGARLDPPLKPMHPGSRALAAAKLGLPPMLERVAFVAGNVAYLAAVAGCGSKALAAHTIGVRLESIAFMPLFSLATAAGAMVSWEVGAGRIEESERLGWSLAKLSAAAGAVIGAALAAAALAAPPLFTSDPEVAKLATVYLLLAAATEAPLAVAMTSAQIIRSAGDTRTPTLVNTGGLYVFRVIPSHLLTSTAPEGLCAAAAWLAMAFDVTARALILAALQRFYYRRLVRRLV